MIQSGIRPGHRLSCVWKLKTFQLNRTSKTDIIPDFPYYISSTRDTHLRDNPWKTTAFSVNNQQKWKQQQMPNFLETTTITSIGKTGQCSGSRCPGTVVPGHQQTQPWLNTETETLLSLAKWISNYRYPVLESWLPFWSDMLNRSDQLHDHWDH